MTSMTMKSLAALLCVGSAIGCLAAADAKSMDSVKRVGPLAGLPSAPGPQIDKIKTLGDNQWICLGSPDPDPNWGKGLGRSWGAKMVYASDLGGAFLAGQGPHGAVKADGRYDDIFFYDANTNRWICIYPGFDTKTLTDDLRSGALKVNEDGQLVDKDGQAQWAIGGHIYQIHTYDWDERKYYLANDAGGLLTDQHSRGSPWYLPAAAIMDEQMKGKEDKVSRMPFVFDTLTGKLSRPGAVGKDRPGCGNAAGVVFYLPTKKVLWFFTQHTQGAFYDPKTRAVAESNATGKAPMGIDLGACYDPKRDRMYLGGGSYRDPLKEGEGYIYSYDVATNAWTNTPNQGKFATHFDAQSSVMHFDSANDRVIVIPHGHEPEQQGVYAWDPATGIWSDAKLDLPAEVMIPACWNAFYSPELNVHFVYIAGDGGEGKMWAYRYKKPAK